MLSDSLGQQLILQGRLVSMEYSLLQQLPQLKLSQKKSKFNKMSFFSNFLNCKIIVIFCPKRLPFRLILSTLFNDLMQINGFTSEEEEVKAQREQFFSKIYWLYSKEYKNLANMKGTEISARIYSILEIYQEAQLQDGLSIIHKYWF